MGQNGAVTRINAVGTSRMRSIKAKVSYQARMSLVQQEIESQVWRQEKGYNRRILNVA